MKFKIALAVVLLGRAWTLKRYYAGASADDLRWMLGPTTALVSTVTGRAFVIEPGAGYLSREQLFLIEKSCAGINFLIAAFVMLAFVLRGRAVNVRSSAAVVAVSLALGYAAAVIVNTVRIAIAMWLARRAGPIAGLSPAGVHRLEGIVV